MKIFINSITLHDLGNDFETCVTQTSVTVYFCVCLCVWGEGGEGLGVGGYT